MAQVSLLEEELGCKHEGSDAAGSLIVTFVLC